jgi:hypothetical protein
VDCYSVYPTWFFFHFFIIFFPELSLLIFFYIELVENLVS